MNYGSVSQFDQPKTRQWDNQKFQGDSSGQKFVIALCRKSVPSEEDVFLDETDKKNAQMKSLDHDVTNCIVNNTGIIEYTRHNMNQYYHVEEVLSMVDVSNEG